MNNTSFPARLRLSAGLAVVGAFFAAALPAQAQELRFTPFRANGIYELGEKAGWTVTHAQGAAAPASGYSYIIRKNDFDIIAAGALDLSSGSATIETRLGEPAMLYAEVTAHASPTAPAQGSQAAAPDAAKDTAIHLGAAVAPWLLQPSVPRPADFDSFWDAKLKALSEIPINPVLTRTETSTPGVELYTVKLDSLGSHVQGYLAKPAKEGKFPALVIYEWAGVHALQPATVTDRAAEGWLAFNVDSHDLPPNQGTGVSTGYQAIGNTDRETSYFLKMYLRDSRAIDYIATRPDWDGKNIVVMGTSMGGHQSLATAGLNPKVTAVIVNEPAGADSNGDLHGRKAGYPNCDSTNPKVMETALYFDTVNFASRIKAPVLAAMGFIDIVVPSVGVWIAINQIPGPKEAIPMVDSNHNNLTPDKIGAFETRSKEVLGIILNGGEFKPNEELTRRK
ncbi:MAG: acetylxylan esterase [Bryobacteraceae bacterium]|jgi:cephalosporin-C deacetylase-like acetyl esterase